VLFREVSTRLEAEGVTIVEPECGELVTSLDMSGVSVTLFWLDDELERLWCDPADSPAYRKGSLGGGSETSEVMTDSVDEADSSVPIDPASAPLTRATPAVVTMLALARDAIDSRMEYLGELDSVAGDGDHGRGMSVGLHSAHAAAEDIRVRGGGAAQALIEAGRAWSDRAGGTSGALWGAALENAGRKIGGRGNVQPTTVAAAVEAALLVVRTLGKAEPGDKTMVDAFVPFARALSYRVDAGLPLSAAWAEAAAIAAEAAENTAQLRPKLGRARPLAERSVGHPDPGAISFGMMMQAVGRR
jgi:dihydroxyacetone kinase